MIKMITCSFYNTLIDKEDAIPLSTMLQIDKARQEKIKFTILTNRSSEELKYYNRDYPFIDYEDKSKIIKQHYRYTELGSSDYYMNYSSYEKIVAIKDKKISLIEPSNMNVEGTITIKEEYSSVKLLRQINNDIYGFATACLSGLYISLSGNRFCLWSVPCCLSLDLPCPRSGSAGRGLHSVQEEILPSARGVSCVFKVVYF